MEGYIVLKELGEGSFGRVLLVHDKGSSQKYAMKEIRLPKSTSDVQNSRKEAIMLAKMEHPNIVAYKESFEADGHLYIVMEYCDDGDLMQKIKHQRGKLFPEDLILHWFAQICLGVKHIHDRRVLHRDIKSKNILLTCNGKAKLGDFGSARLLTNPMAYACTYVGTPYYVPPEIWENMPYNNKSDIWSLGCILYELCTLKHPFQANSWKHLILKICKGFYNPLSSHYSYELHYLIKQMFKKNPKNRPSASTILARGCLSKLIKNYQNSKRNNSEQKNVTLPRKTTLPSPQRQQWEKGASSTAVNVLENAPLLSSSFTPKEGGCVIKYSENNPRKQWIKDTPETLMNLLQNADISLAFKTYTIYKAASEDVLSGPLSDEVKSSDEVDGESEAIIVDTERLEPRSDEEDTDFEEEDDPDWVSELKTKTEMQ
uniref:non-specific serine/threonine protein kinase n=1 Tax=Sphenodon punctatus TaxID=8508 RepID=A0A8D0GQ73_SPHPU